VEFKAYTQPTRYTNQVHLSRVYKILIRVGEYVVGLSNKFMGPGVAMRSLP